MNWEQKQNNFKSAFEMGNKAEQEFASILKNNYNIECRHGSVEEDKSHRDFFFIIDGKEYTCDVKAEKKINRKDTDSADDLVWIEYNNGNGYPGWLFGEQDYVAFQNNGDFYLVRTDELRRLAHLRINDNETIHKTSSLYFKKHSEMPNRKYFRQNKNDPTGNNRNYSYDILGLLKFEDIKSITRKIFKKDVKNV